MGRLGNVAPQRSQNRPFIVPVLGKSRAGKRPRQDSIAIHVAPQAAVIMSPDDLESLEETLEILSNPAAVRAIRRAETEIDKGEALAADELRAKYLER